MGGNRRHPNGSIVCNYSFAEVIGKSGIYFYDTIRVGLFVQAPWNDYPAHAHDSEECLNPNGCKHFKVFLKLSYGNEAKTLISH